MSELILKKKKKRILLEELESENSQNRMLSKQEVINQVIRIFKKKIGETNIVNNADLFEMVYGVTPDTVEIYKRVYYWELIVKIVKMLRRKDKIFIIIKKQGMFTLQTQEEADFYKAVCEVAKKRMDSAELRADKWVAEEKWKYI